MYTSIDENFTNNLIGPPILTDIVSNKLSNSSRRNLYAGVGMHLTSDLANSVTPQFVDLGFYTIDALDKRSGICSAATKVRRPTNVSNWSAPDYIIGETTSVGDAVSAK